MQENLSLQGIFVLHGSHRVADCMHHREQWQEAALEEGVISAHTVSYAVRNSQGWTASVLLMVTSIAQVGLVPAWSGSHIAPLILVN